jgi:acetate kinase
VAADGWILVLNAGSSSLKYEVVDSDDKTLVVGEVGRIGGAAYNDIRIDWSNQPEGRPTQTGPRHFVRPCRDHGAAVDWAIATLVSTLAADWQTRVTGVGHRVVHGGASLWQPTLVDDSVFDELTRLIDLAPLHNRPALTTLLAARSLIPDARHVTVFDTGFHHDLPMEAQTYALPRRLAAEHGLRRYGFHGTSVRYVISRLAELRVAPVHRAIVCHLGAGASVSAVLDGRPHDTSMGFTPLEGLVMATRSGDLDPAIPLYLERHAGLTRAEVEHLLEHESGLRGLSDRSGDYVELESAAANGDSLADLALRVFAYRVRKYLGSYWAALGGVDVVVFTGGIGEHSADARARIMGPLAGVGWRLDPDRNAAGPAERAIAPDEQHPAIWVIPTRETLQIAREVRRRLKRL